MTNEDLWQDPSPADEGVQPTINEADVLCTTDCNGQGSCNGGEWYIFIVTSESRIVYKT